MRRPNIVRDFLVVYIALIAMRTLPRLKRKADLKQNLNILLSKGKGADILKEALFAVAIPRSYSFWSRRYPKSNISPFLSSPLLQLVEPSLRRTLAVYVATTAAVNFRRDARLRQKLPPTWTLILVANSWLLWAFLFERKCFPRGYGDLILRHSGYGSGEDTDQLVKFLQQTQFETHPPGVLSSRSVWSRSVHPAHTRAVCARLHPSTPSCLKTYIKAWLTQFPKVFRWVGAFGALALLLKGRKPRKKPRDVLKDWFISSLRGTAFVVGTINTCWGLTCLFQHILRPGVLPQFRWIANSLLGDLWVLVLPARRRTDFALYCTRLAIVSLWDLLNGWSPKYGEVLVLALSWSSLLHDRRKGKDPHGLGGMVMQYFDSHLV